MKLAIDTDNKIFALDASLIDFEAWVVEEPSYPTDGLIARYDFNDNLEDSYGTSSDFVVYAGPATWEYGTDAMEGKSYFVDSTAQDVAGSRIDNTDPSIMAVGLGTSEFGFSLWIKRTNLTQAGFTVLHRWANTGNLIGFNGSGGNISPGGTAGACAMAFGQGWGNLNGTTDLRDDTWHHVVVTGDSTTVYLYVDTVLEDSTARTSNGATTSIFMGGGDNNGQWALNGGADLLYYYNQLLSTDDVAQLYNNGDGV